MPKILPAVFSYEDMKKRWNQDNPNEPYGRSDNLQNGIYAIDNWLIRVDDEDNAIATGGWTEYPTHTVVGGLYAVERADTDHPEHDPKLRGNARAIQDAREPQLNPSKPIIASFNQQRGDNARWIATAKKTQKFIFSDDPEWKQAISVLPKEVVKEWTEKSGDRWGIRNILNTDELAKCIYPDDPIPSWFSLLKYYPDDSFEHLDIAEPVPDLGTRDKFKDMDIKSLANVDKKGIVTEEYLRQVYNRISEPTNTMMNDWLERIHKQNLPRGKYWFFATKEKSNKSYVTFNMINKGDRYLPTSSKKLNIVGMDNAVVFVGVSKDLSEKDKRGQYIPAGRKFVDIWGDGDRRGLIQSLSQRKLPKEPVDIFRKSWKEILKWKPNEEYKPFNTYKTKESGNFESLIHESLLEKDNMGHPVLVAGHYLFRGEERIKKDIGEYELHDWALDIVGKINSLDGSYWFYRKPTDSQAIMFDVVPNDTILPQQSETSKETKIRNKTGQKVLVFTTVYPENKIPKDSKWYDMWEEEKQRKISSIRMIGMTKSIEQIKREINSLNSSNQKDRNMINFLRRQMSGQTKAQKKLSEKRISEAENRIQHRNKEIAWKKEQLRQNE